MKESYAVRRTVPPSAEIQTKIDKLLSSKLVEDPQKMLSELARLGAKLIIQRAVEEEFDSWLGRARYERRPERQRGLRNCGDGYRNGYRARAVQTAEGELRIEIPQAREAAEPFVSRLFRRGHTKRLLRTDPLKAMVVGAFVRGLSVRCGGIGARACFAEAAGVAEVLAGCPIRGDLQAHVAVRRVAERSPGPMRGRRC